MTHSMIVARLKVSTDVSFSKILNKRIDIPTDIDLDDIEYEVEKILDHYHHKQSNTYSYLIKWKGYSEIFQQPLGTSRTPRRWM